MEKRMEHNIGICHRGFRVQGYSPPIVENQIEKNIEHDIQEQRPRNKLKPKLCTLAPA